MTDLAFEALCQVCGLDWRGEITSDQRGRMNAALKQLREIYPDDLALPMMIHERAAAWKIVYPDIPVTPQALTGNWSTILNAAEAAQVQEKEKASERRRVTNAHGGNRDCPDCGGDGMVVIMVSREGHDIAARCPRCSS